MSEGFKRSFESIESKVTDLEIRSARRIRRARIGGYVFLAAGIIGVGIGLAYVVDIGHPASDVNVEAPARPVPPGYAVIEAPNPQDNVVTFCHLGNRIYQRESSSQSLSVVAADPSCEGK